MTMKHSPPRFRIVAGGLNAAEREFLPAALEVTETPPSPAGRALLVILCLATVAGIAWSVLGSLDIVAVAPGKIVALARTQVVQPFETGTVRSIHVADGQPVKAGDPLVDLDATTALAERDRAQSDFDQARLDEARLDAFIDGAPDLLGDLDGLDKTMIRRARAALVSQIDERDAKLAALARAKDMRISERETLKLTLEKVEETLPLVTQRAQIRQASANTGFGSQLLSLETEQLAVETRYERDIDRSKLVSLGAEIDGFDQQIAATKAEILKTALADLTHARDRAAASVETLTKARRRLELQTLRAPIDGIVQQLHVRTVGGVVTPAEQLLVLVPTDGPVEVEAVLENRDAGFVTAGQPVELKVDAYPFTTYGLVKGMVTNVSRDAESATPVQGTAGAQNAADQIQNIEGSERLRYKVRIRIDDNPLRRDGTTVSLLPGMSVKAEILTGKRRIIDYVLSPLTEYRHDSLRER